ncbi:hypothetical protein J1N35_001700 [Gossypium stocksii]|uniref:RNase H type-1 domain-containing protein n=1 Tax=Gossypium stocksii TaxID=47602 RepID=A0A9D4ALK4_9ROSI|nr:hypothetical protein J1N35_001700 [Gossypium stocksii]
MVNGEDRELHHEPVVRVKNMLRWTWEVKVQHVYRQGNAVADHMAALAREYGMDLQIYRSPPVELMKHGAWRLRKCFKNRLDIRLLGYFIVLG